MTTAEIKPATTLRAADGVSIDAYHDISESTDLGIVVAHGFTGSWRRPAVRRVVNALRAHGGVVSFDFRGHGRSGGVSTVGDREVLDLQAAVDWAAELGYARVATVGFSMGASIVVRQAGLRSAGVVAPVAMAPAATAPVGLAPIAEAPVGLEPVGLEPVALEPVALEPVALEAVGVAPVAVEPVALEPVAVKPVAVAPVAVVAVSGPARWYYRGTPAMRRAHWAIEKPMGRLVSRIALGTRISADGWDPVPEAPHEVAARISPVPLLIVHGDADHYFPIEHAQQLYAAAREPKQLWLEPGFGHAENAVTDELVHRIGTWIRTVADR